ncbi:NAD-dependent epimerase/dehydratase family protein, partial [Candidatus Woesebacteria bacterium]|nr:NAD-dependent epimerase/dehydratase family protein [Candidatus Woesebacteria bacterium]
MGLSQNSGSILVTGAAGFLGSHLCDALLAQEYKVIGVDNYLTGRRENLKVALANPNFTFVEADVTTDPVTYLGIEQTIQAVLHFASPASPPRYQEYP